MKGIAAGRERNCKTLLARPSILCPSASKTPTCLPKESLEIVKLAPPGVNTKNTKSIKAVNKKEKRVRSLIDLLQLRINIAIIKDSASPVVGFPKNAIRRPIDRVIKNDLALDS